MTIPLIPNNLRDLLEAPVPILAGITYIEAKLRHTHPNIIWVLLDEKDLNHRIQCQSSIIQDISDVQSVLTDGISKHYSFDSKFPFENSLENRDKVLKISKISKNYWLSILKKFPPIILKNKAKTEQILLNFPENDQKFIRALTQTQMFVNSLDYINI